MNRETFGKYAKRLALGLAALAIAATPSFAQTTYDLCASDGTVTIGAATIPIWGYADISGGGSCTLGLATLPGPELRATAGETLTINLSNALLVPVSFFAPGLLADTVTGAAGMFTAEATATPASYTFTNIEAGTYLYHSGTDITTQVPMGLYGALVVDVAAGQAYGDVYYDQDEVLVYSEIDANLNADPANFGGARVINWNPQYFLINGEAHPATADITIDTSADVLLRFVNAGLRTFFPTLDGGLYMYLKAEDGNRYPQPLQQYGIELQAGKTIDALINAGDDGTYALYDRGASYDSGVTNIVAGAVVGAPIAVDDPYSVAEDVTLTADGVLPNPAGVLDNDTPGTGGTMTATLVSDVSAGTLTLSPGGSFTYTPDSDFNGTDIFTYFANDGGPNSNVATVTIDVTPANDPPTAVPDFYDAVEGLLLSVDTPGVLENDSDVDGDLSLTAIYVSGPIVVFDVDLSATGPGVLTLNADGSFSHDPTGTGLNAGDQVTFEYKANDGALDSNVVTVTLTVVPPADNIPPFANDDFATAAKNSTGNIINVTSNDVDADGTIDVTTVVITTGGNTQRGGTVVSNGDGTVTYTPKRGFRGTDTFKYTVDDNDGATSNEATVRINVS